MMFLTEIEVTLSTGEKEFYEGPIVTANNFEEAQELAIKMNPELEVVGEYVDSLGNGYGLGFFKL